MIVLDMRAGIWNPDVCLVLLSRGTYDCGGIADPAYRGVWNVYTSGGPPSDDLCDLSPRSEFTFLMSSSLNKLSSWCSSYILDE